MAEKDTPQTNEDTNTSTANGSTQNGNTEKQAEVSKGKVDQAKEKLTAKQKKIRDKNNPPGDTMRLQFPLLEMAILLNSPSTAPRTFRSQISTRDPRIHTYMRP